MKFEISWKEGIGYRVSRPSYLNDGERATVVEIADYEEAVDLLRVTFFGFIRGSTSKTAQDIEAFLGKEGRLS